MCDYQNSKIYKIVDVNEEMVYIGSTTQALSKRFAAHRSLHKSLTLSKCTVSTIFTKFGIENCKIVLIEAFPCNNKEELIKKEAEYIQTINCVNKRIEGRTKKEYREANKDSIKEYYVNNKEALLAKAKEHYVDNKEALLAKNKEYYEANKESITTYQKEYQKEYRDVNKEKIATQHKEYREANKEAIAAKAKARYEAKKALPLE